MTDLAILPVCYCPAHDGTHVHLPDMIDGQYGLRVSVLAPRPDSSQPEAAPPSATETADPPQPRFARHQPCGCVVCRCEDEERCGGCGAKSCGTHRVGEIPNPVYEPAAMETP